MELVTGKAGTPHVSSADDGRRIAGEVGTGSYVLKTGGGLAPSLVDANTIRFATGDMVVQGRHIGLTAPEDVKVASGTQGKKRTDYICVHYKRDVSGANPTLVETCEWKVLQGTPGTDATAPTVPAGSILDGDAEATVPVASVDFDGLTTGEPKLLIPTLTPLADLGDSVSPTIAQYGGWSHIEFGRLAVCYGEFHLDNVYVNKAWANNGVTYGYYSNNINLPDLPVEYREAPSMSLSVSYFDTSSDDPGIAVFNPRTGGGKKCQTFYFTRPTASISGHPNVNVTAIGLLKE